MKVMWKAVCAAVLLITATTIEIGCGETYRPIAVPTPATTGNPAGSETEVVLNQRPDGSSSATNINVSGDTNEGNKSLGNVASAAAFDYSRTNIFTANTASDSVTQLYLATSTAGFASNTNTILLEAGSKPIGISFQYFGTTYSTEYVVNSGKTTSCPNSGSIGAITQASAELKATICVGATPVVAWIYKDQTKVFVLDQTENKVYVVNASQSKVTNKISVGSGPFKVTQSADGNYVYILNGNDGSISIIDGQAEKVVGTITTTNALSSALPVDLAQDVQYNETTKNVQYNHIWVMQADGTVSVLDANNPGTLSWITSLSTITTAQYNAGVRPTNLALMRDGTGAYVGLAGTDQIVGIDTSKLATNAITPGVNSCPTLPCSVVPATTAVTVGVHRSVNASYKDTGGTSHSVLVETTTPKVTWVAVSRGGDTSYLSKAYAATTTSTTYYYYDANVHPTTNATYPNLYNGTTVVTAAASGTTPINTYITTIMTPSDVTYCDPGNPVVSGVYDGQKGCPSMVPVTVLGRN